MNYIAASVPLILDLFLKNRIEHQPDGAFPRTVMRGLITLEKHHNYGFCLNRGETHPELVTAAACGLFAGFTTLLAPTHRFSFQLILSGSLSNLIDRLLRGYVVDFFRLPIKPIRHLIMNLGDLCIFLGCFLMFWAEASSGSSEKTAANP